MLFLNFSFSTEYSELITSHLTNIVLKLKLNDKNVYVIYIFGAFIHFLFYIL